MINFVINAFKANWISASIWTLVILAVIYYGWKLLWFGIRYAYTRYQHKNLVFLHVLLPREDSPKDKDKATEKDFREKIAIMEQLYRTLHEIEELNLWNTIKVKILKHAWISLEMVAQNKLIDFYLITDTYYSDMLIKQVTSYYPNADIQFTDEPKIIEKNNYNKGFYMYQKKPFWFPIKTYKKIENDPLNDMTNVLSKLEEGERACMQFVIMPRSDRWAKKAEDVGTAMFKGKKGGRRFKIPGLGLFYNLFVGLFMGYDKIIKDSSSGDSSKGDPLVRMLAAKEEVAKQIGEKSGKVGFDTAIRIFASAKNDHRTTEILNNMVLAFNLFKDASMNYFQNRRIVPIDKISFPILYHNYRYRLMRFLEKKRNILVPEELATVIHFPNSRYNYTPVIRWLQYKVLPAPPDLPKEGVLLGYNVFRGDKQEVRFLKDDRTRHQYVIGKSGTGKSAFINYMARQDMANGEGLCVVDPHGDLVEDLLGYVPKNRVKDVIYFDPADQERPMGLNILEAKTPEQQDMASSQATEIFIKLFGDEIFGPRIQHYFRNACLTLMEDQEEGATLIDVPRIFTDDAFMKHKVAKTKNPVVRSFWEHEYAHTGERERQEMIPYFSSKFGPFITNSIMRNTIGQTKSSFNIRECMDSGKILLINLSKGRIGDLNTQLLGLIIVARIQMAAMGRVDTLEKDRKPFYLYVDEFQNFATDSFCSILSEARKYKLGLIMAHQFINQLVSTKYGSTSSKIRDAVFGNVGTLMSFKVGAEDAEYLSKEYAPVLTESDIISIANFKAYIKLNIKNTTSRPFSLETIWDPHHNEKIYKIAKQYSRMKYARKRMFVDQEICSRIGIDVTTPVKSGLDQPSATPDMSGAPQGDDSPPPPQAPSDGGLAALLGGDQ
ncbi:type IV secretory system conjugative DNA transfer family protein [Patescibacteria group bacterium]|nr:type IV secretory system conjugative DNA transfer family protein [Patescibacteria group bacterium]